MKTLYLVRHAKSDWGNAHTGDFQRTLNHRGLKAAPYMAALLKEKKVFPELVISSPANRALTTAEFFCEILGYLSLAELDEALSLEAMTQPRPMQQLPN